VLAFARALTALTGVGLVALPFLYNRSRPLYWPMAGTVVGLFGASSFMWWRMRRDDGRSRGAFRAFMTLSLLAGVFVEYDLGLFSPAPLFVTLGITFLAQSRDRAFALGATLFS